ncbi:MAG: hypothetical protein IJE83_03420 [Oscillospiraceae bacterium]|nr:hypothetical protein [Oscillospiraceae bacterium]MBQ2861820.1 hypothetical protein [Oscillospiraceae bacterium]MBQ2997672.1 hypothetical protein [Oscillospiraceae bacterium]MBQ3561670.1 hypothetical protein [Oscillospiraceae bacterium]MBQ4117855.1 hypothetical protein [Oscillospiraceae bacterium]
MKKIIFIILSVVLCFSMSLTAFSAEEAVGLAETSEEGILTENADEDIVFINEETGEETPVPLYDVCDSFAYGPHAVRVETTKLGEICGTIYYKHNGTDDAVITTLSSLGTVLEESASVYYRMSVGQRTINGNKASFRVTFVALDGTHSIKRDLEFSVSKNGNAIADLVDPEE